MPLSPSAPRGPVLAVMHWYYQQIRDVLTGKMVDQDVTLGRHLIVRGDLTVDGSSPGGGVTDHGLLTGLEDNDHSQYSQTAHAHAGVYEPASAGIQTHLGITAGNPHGTSAADVGAAATGHNHAGTYEPADVAIQTHVDTVAGNPHGTTAADVGAAASGHNHSGVYEPASAAIQTHVTAMGNPHSSTPADIGAATSGHNHAGTYEPANANIQTHIGSTANPHATTGDQVLPSQVGQSGKFLTTNATTVSWGTPGGSGGGAKAVYINLINHFTTLENTVSANATWKIPAAATYGQIAAHLDMTKLGTPTSVSLIVVYTNTATTGTNEIGIRIGAAPLAAGTTVTPVTSSVATLANSSTYPQTIIKVITPSELGTSAVWLQWCLKLATSTVGPNVMSLALVLYY